MEHEKNVMFALRQHIKMFHSLKHEYSNKICQQELIIYCHLSRTHCNIPPHSDNVPETSKAHKPGNKKEDMIQLGDGAWGANWTPLNFIFITTFTYNVIPKICVYHLLHDPQ
jgi:hypothetical protein